MKNLHFFAVIFLLLTPLTGQSDWPNYDSLPSWHHYFAMGERHPTVYFCIAGVALWAWLHVKIARRTNFRNRIIVHIMAFLLFCGSVALGLFSYFHFAVFSCF